MDLSVGKESKNHVFPILYVLCDFQVNDISHENTDLLSFSIVTHISELKIPEKMRLTHMEPFRVPSRQGSTPRVVLTALAQPRTEILSALLDCASAASISRGGEAISGEKVK